MADFQTAFKITILGNEGGYNPGIGERETYKGIDRGANPGWSGWKIIDALTDANPHLSVDEVNEALAKNSELQANIAAFYRINYWQPVALDAVNDQQLANNLFDCSVNQGEGLARKFMQQACNVVIGESNSLLKTLVVDKQIGPETLNAVNTLPASKLMDAINSLRLASYQDDSEFSEWGSIWEKRLLKYKTS